MHVLDNGVADTFGPVEPLSRRLLSPVIDGIVPLEQQGDRAMKMILVTASFATLLASTVFASAASDPYKSGVTGGGSSGYNWAIIHDVKFDPNSPAATGGGSSGYNWAVAHDV
jgi:hypothetical protein